MKNKRRRHRAAAQLKQKRAKEKHLRYKINVSVVFLRVRVLSCDRFASFESVPSMLTLNLRNIVSRTTNCSFVNQGNSSYKRKITFIQSDHK